MAPKVLELSAPARLPPALRSPTFNERPHDGCPVQNEKKKKTSESKMRKTKTPDYDSILCPVSVGFNMELPCRLNDPQMRPGKGLAYAP